MPLQIVDVTTTSVDTGCGRITNVQQLAIFYCAHDAGIYFDTAFRERIRDEFDGYAWTMIVAHEWGHHIQALLGIDLAAGGEEGLTYIDLELQADCLAAIYVQDSFAGGQIEQDDVEAGLTIVESAGDPVWVTRENRRAHGSPAERVQMFQAGFNDGFTGCGIEFHAA